MASRRLHGCSHESPPNDRCAGRGSFTVILSQRTPLLTFARVASARVRADNTSGLQGSEDALMNLLVVPLLLAATDGAPEKTAPTLELFAAESFYKDQPGKEQEFIGVLKKADKGGGIGFGRFNPYRLEMSKDMREVYVGGKPNVLLP